MCNYSIEMERESFRASWLRCLAAAYEDRADWRHVKPRCDDLTAPNGRGHVRVTSLSDASDQDQRVSDQWKLDWFEV